MKFYTNVRTYGNNIFYRWIEDGQRYQQKIEYSPTLYVPSNTPTQFKTLQGEFVKDLPMGSINEAKKFIESYKDVDNFKIYGNTKWHYQFIADNFPEQDIKWDINQLKIANFDIEVDSSQGMPNIALANREVISIAYRINDVYWVYGLKEFTHNRSDLHYVQCSNERELLMAFLNRWASDYPDIITGWNIEFFDIPYLAKRMELVLGTKEMKRLSPWGKVNFREVAGLYGKKPRPTYELMGVSTIDYIDAYRKFTFKVRESYRLDYIAKVELKQQKLDYKSAGYKSLSDLYAKNHQLFIEYNIHDVELVARLEDKLNLITLILTLAYKSKINLEDPFFQVRMWDTLIYNDLLSKNIVVPQPTENTKTEKYAGAYVMEPKEGTYHHIVSYDLTSLYPHLILQYNISPETLVEHKDLPLPVKQLLDSGVSVDTMLTKEVDLAILKSFNLTITPNGQFFRTDIKGFLPTIISKMFNERKAAKDEMLRLETEIETIQGDERVHHMKILAKRLSILEQGIKVTLNSAYGSLGNEFSRYFDVRLAAGITTAGQLSIKWVQNAINRYLRNVTKADKDYVFYVDTDSNYICLDDIVKLKYPDGCTPEESIDFMDKVCKNKLTPEIDKCYQELADYVNAYEQKMHMKREILADIAIWTGKKHYAINAYDSEGVRYATPEIKVKGLETVKSSTPEVCRDALKHCIKLMLTAEEKDLVSYVTEFREKFAGFSADQIAFPRGVNGVEEYADESALCKKGTPIHVRGALVYNKLVKDMKLRDTHPLIVDADKIRFTYLTEPNPTKQNVIAFPDELPPEFGLDKYVDSMLQFDKSFGEPVRNIASCRGWSTEKKSSLSKFKRKVA